MPPVTPSVISERGSTASVVDGEGEREPEPQSQFIQENQGDAPGYSAMARFMKEGDEPLSNREKRLQNALKKFEKMGE
ncbi:hypothetical protein TWF718_002699 [Orbilia javanica]|uniref:Uncharacterized protein n=1 Tax=Orbilia javanica TaxID=47235 RepID=A0AAN8MNV1_9PEZI